MKDAAAYAATLLRLPDDWLNNAVGSFTPELESDDFFLLQGDYPRGDRPGLKVFMAKPEQCERALGRSFGSRRLAQTALQLYEPIGENVEELPRFAVVRWLEEKGHSKLRIFGPAPRLPARGRQSENASEDDDLRGAGEFHDVLSQYCEHRLFQVRAVARTALIDIGAALKGVQATYGNAYGNTR